MGFKKLSYQRLIYCNEVVVLIDFVLMKLGKPFACLVEVCCFSKGRRYPHTVLRGSAEGKDGSLLFDGGIEIGFCLEAVFL